MRSSSLLLLGLGALASCAMPSLGLQPRYGRLDISGTAGFSSAGLGGAADLEQAGLEEEESPSGRLDLDFGSPHLVGLVQAPSFEGSGTLDVTLSDGTDTINVGQPVDTELDLGQYSLALVFDLFPGDTFELALGFGAAYFDVDAQFVEQGTGTTVDSEEQVPVPFVAGLASVWIGPVELAAMLAGMDITYEDDSAVYLDADLLARWMLFGGSKRLRTSLVVGYRFTRLELDYDDDSADIDLDLDLQGAYLGLELSL